MVTRKLYQVLAGKISAINHLMSLKGEKKNADTQGWIDAHTDRLEELAKNHLPSGSGINQGSTIHLDKSTSDKIIILADFQHMDDVGFYTGWTSHKIIVTPSMMCDFDLKVTGRNKNGIKEYLGDTFSAALTAQVRIGV